MLAIAQVTLLIFAVVVLALYGLDALIDWFRNR